MNKIDYKELYLQQKKDLNAKINTNKILIREKKMIQQKIDEAIDYIKNNEKEYGSLEENEKIILDILRGEDIKEIPQFEGTLEQLDKLSIRGEEDER